MNEPALEFSVAEFVALLNQTMEYAYSGVVIYGELANFRVSKDKWVYFDLKDDEAVVSFFGTVYNLPGPIEDGMMLKVKGTPRLHPRWGFSVNVASITPAGSGTIKKLSELVRAKLEAEGLFAHERKRPISYPPSSIGLITAVSSAAFADFTKIINARWAGLDILAYNVSVQGDQAVEEITSAIKYFSDTSEPPDVIVIIRGGGSPEDLAAYNNEIVVRSVAASRVPTLVAIGHESDTSLAELAADRRASTPSNAAELLVPDKQVELNQLSKLPNQLRMVLSERIKAISLNLDRSKSYMKDLIENRLSIERARLKDQFRLIAALSPKDILRRGYAIVYKDGMVSDGSDLISGSIVSIELKQATFKASILKKVKGAKHG